MSSVVAPPVSCPRLDHHPKNAQKQTMQMAVTKRRGCLYWFYEKGCENEDSTCSEKCCNYISRVGHDDIEARKQHDKEHDKVGGHLHFVGSLLCGTILEIRRNKNLSTKKMMYLYVLATAHTCEKFIYGGRLRETSSGPQFFKECGWSW